MPTKYSAAILFAACLSSGLILASLLSYGYFAADLLILDGMGTMEYVILNGGFALAFFYFGGAIIYLLDWPVDALPQEYVSPEWYEWTVFMVGASLCVIGYVVTVYTASSYTFTAMLAFGALGGGIFYWNIWKVLPAFVGGREEDWYQGLRYQEAAFALLATPYFLSAMLSYINLILNVTCAEGHSSWYCLYLGLSWTMFVFMILAAFIVFFPSSRKTLQRYRQLSKETPSFPTMNGVDFTSSVEVLLYQIVFYSSYSYVPLFARSQIAYPDESVVVNAIATMDWGILVGLTAAFSMSYHLRSPNTLVTPMGMRKNATVWKSLLMLLIPLWFACERSTHTFLPYVFFLGVALGGVTYTIYDSALLYSGVIAKPPDDIRLVLTQFVISIALGQVIGVFICSFVVWEGSIGYMYLSAVAMSLLFILHLTTLGITCYQTKYSLEDIAHGKFLTGDE